MDSLLEVLKKKALQTVQSTGNAIKNNILLKPGTSAYSMTQPVRELAPIAAKFPLYKPAVEAGKQLFEGAKKELYTPSKTIGGFTKNVGVPLAKTAAYTYGAAASTPQTLIASAGLGGGLNTIYDAVVNRSKAKPVQSFMSGVNAGIESTPKLSLISKFTNPAIDRFSNVLASKFVNPVAKQAISRVSTGIANIPEGMIMKKSLTDMPYTVSDAAFDFTAGSLLGAHQSKARAKGTTDNIIGMHPDDIQEVTNVYKRMKGEYEFTGKDGYPNFDKIQEAKDKEFINRLYEQHIYSGKEAKDVSFQRKVEDLFEQARYNFRNRTPAFGLLAGEQAKGYTNAENKFSSLADKKPRFEIDDSKAQLIKEGLYKAGRGEQTTLGQVIDHPDLFKQYPSLKYVSVDIADTGSTGAYFDGNRIVVNKNYLSDNVKSENTKSTLLHEIQHAIQQKEGFATGGSPSQFNDLSKNANLNDLFNRQWDYVNSLKQGTKEWELANDELQRLARELEIPQKQYQRLSGEIEARDVQSRMNLNPDQRIHTQPYASQNIPLKDQIVKFDDEVSASIDSVAEKAAIKKFGTTNDPKLGAFISSDGKMIDGSGRSQTGPENWKYMNDRVVDHREIATSGVSYLPKGVTASEALIEYMNRTGNIRMSMNDNELNLDLSVMPNKQQLKTIEKISNGKTIVADISDSKGYVKASGDFNNFSEYKKWLEKNIVSKDVMMSVSETDNRSYANKLPLRKTVPKGSQIENGFIDHVGNLKQIDGTHHEAAYELVKGGKGGDVYEGALSELMQRGNIRSIIKPKEANFEIIGDLYDTQLRKMASLSEGKTINIDITNTDGKILESKTFSDPKELVNYLSPRTISIITRLRKVVPKGSYTNDPSIDNPLLSATPKTDIKNQIKDLRKQAQESILEQKLAKGVLKEELAPFTKQDLQDFSAVRKMANSREGAAGDIETLYKKNPQLVTKVLERVREQYRNIDTDEEALNKLMSMPKKSDTYVVKPPEYAKIQALKERLKTASDMVYHAEPNIYRRRAIFRNQEYKDWAAAVYKDTAKAEKETLEKNIDTVVNAIKGSFDKVKPTPKQKIGIFDLFRTPEKVLNKIGLGYEAKLLRGQYEKYLKELPVEINKVTEWSKRVTPEGNVKIFRYLDGSLTNADLTPQELKVAGEIKTYLGEWADKLNLPKEKRITNYITHIFDQDFIQKEFDPDIAKLIRDKVPGSVYDPFVEKRLGKLGYKEDTWSALDAYIKRGVRKFNMDPALAKIKDKAQYLEESQYDYVKNYIDRINMRPTKYDNLIDNTIKQVVGYKFGQRPVTALTQKLRQTVYRATLGLNIGSAMRNLTQGANTYAKLGEKYTVVGYTNMIKNMLAGSDELKQVGVLSDDIIQDRTINATKKFWENADKGLFVFFNLAEKINRGAAYYGAKAQGIAKGMDEEQAIEYARKLVRDTQFSFGSIDTPAILQSDLAKTAMQFQSYNVKQAEFLAEMAKNKDYKGLARFTGASLAMVYTVGQLFGMKPTDLIPFYDQLTGIGEGKLPQSPLQTLATGVSTVGDLGSEDETKKNKAWQNLEKSAALTVPAGSQIRKTLRGLEATSKGYSESLTGRVQFPVAQTPVNTIRAGLFGKSNLPESQQYFNSGETVLGEKQSQRLKESNDKQGVYESVLAEREANRKQSQINEIKNSILDSYLTGDIARAKQLAIENKINLTKKDAKQYQNKIKSDILDFYIDGNMVKAEDTAKKYKINLTRADLKKRAKSRAIALYKKAKSLDNQILMNEAERLAKQYGLIITRKDVE